MRIAAGIVFAISLGWLIGSAAADLVHAARACAEVAL